jgi:predicted protein tyrosine phosphatase
MHVNLKKSVLVVPKTKFKETVEKYGNSNVAYISIEATEECRKYYLEEEKEDFDNEHILNSSDNVLNLEFDDITSDHIYKGHLFKAISEKQAEEIVEFIERNLGKMFIVHCKAGRSRSQAVGRFIVDFYDYDEEEPLLSTPNITVLGELKRAYYKIHGYDWIS